jgi:hypothetical protein
MRQNTVRIYSHTMYAVFTSYENQVYHFMTENHIEWKQHPTHIQKGYGNTGLQ